MFESTQAKYLAYPSIVVILLAVANYIRMAVEGKTSVWVWIGTALGFFFGVLYLALNIFNVNCLVTGSCSVWAWFVWFFAMLKLIVIMVLLVISLVMPRKKKDEPSITPVDATAAASTTPTLATTASASTTPTLATTAPVSTTPTTSPATNSSPASTNPSA